MNLSAAARAALRLSVPPVSEGMPVWGEDPSPEAIDAAELLSILSASKVGLASIARRWDGLEDPLWRGLAARHEVAAAVRAEESLKASLLQSYLEAAGALRIEGIEPVIFKSPSWFPYLSSNIDVLVRPSRFADAARILEGLGHIRLAHYREDHKVLFRTFAGGEPALSVHLHEAVSWGKVVVLTGDQVVARSVPGEDRGVSVACPQDALAASIAHSILETDQIRLSDLRIARWTLAGGADVPHLFEEASRGRWVAVAAAGLLLFDDVAVRAGSQALIASADRTLAEEALAAHPWASRASRRIVRPSRPSFPFALPRWHAKLHLARLIVADDRRDTERKVLDLGASAWNIVSTRLRVRCRPACLITVSGPDGAGKSRVAEAIAGNLALCEVPVRRVWGRGGFSAIATAGKALARRATPGLVPAPSDEEAKRRFLAAGWRRALWAWAVALEQAFLIQRLRLWRLLGRSVVCDRYVYDTLADLLARISVHGPGAAPPGAAAFLLGAAPAPDLALFIDVPPEVAHARKSDGASLEALGDLVSAYAALGGLAPFARLRGEGPLPAVLQEAVTRALRTCFSRFERGRP